MSDQLWDANDVANFLKVSRSWVYQRAEAGLLPYLKVGALLRFDPEEIRAYAKSLRHGLSRVVRITSNG
jgi:excisionase family DNA binding protein